MKYFAISTTDDLSVIGNYPQIQKLEKYDVSSFNSYYNISWDSFPNFVPNYEIKINDKAKVTNLLASLSGFYGLTIDEQIKKVFNQFELPPHRFYPIKVFYKNTQLKYYWFHFIDSFINYIDFDNSVFELFQKTKFEILKEIKVSSIKELHKLEAELNFEKGIRIKKIIVNKSFPNYDIISLWNVTPIFLVSERLKSTLEECGFKGFKFKEYTALKPKNFNI